MKSVARLALYSILAVLSAASQATEFTGSYTFSDGNYVDFDLDATSVNGLVYIYNVTGGSFSYDGGLVSVGSSVTGGIFVNNLARSFFDIPNGGNEFFYNEGGFAAVEVDGSVPASGQDTDLLVLTKVSSVAEPASPAFFLVGLGLIGAVVRKRKH